MRRTKAHFGREDPIAPPGLADKWCQRLVRASLKRGRLSRQGIERMEGKLGKRKANLAVQQGFERETEEGLIRMLRS